MALQKNLNHASGVTVRYWRIEEIVVRKDAVMCRLAGYIDQQARQAGKVPLHSKYFDFVPDSAVINQATNIWQWAYSKIKETQEFQNAQDV